LGTALLPLKKLRNLYLGIFLTSEALLHAYIVKCMDQWVAESADMLGSSPEEHVCYDSAVQLAHSNEMKSSLLMAKMIKTLRKISWSTLFRAESKGCQVSEDCDDGERQDLFETLSDEEQDQIEDENQFCSRSLQEKVDKEDGDMKVDVYIQRRGGRITVKKMPWY
jgi:hypothetical protein